MPWVLTLTISIAEVLEKAANQGIVAIVPAKYLAARSKSDTHYEYRFTPFKPDAKGEQSLQKFNEDAVLAIGTGFFATPSCIVTAAHVLFDLDKPVNLSNFHFILNWTDHRNTKIPKSSVITGDKCKLVTSPLEKFNTATKDFAVIQLQEGVELPPGAAPLSWSRKTDGLKLDDTVTVVGHPFGLSLKSATGKISKVWQRILNQNLSSR